MNKAKAGTPELIRKCIGCLYCRERVLGGGLPIRCAVNPRTAREIEFPLLHKSGQGKQVAVVGGGPAGMQAAITLAERGYKPILFEKEEELGGTLNIADKPPLKDKITRFKESMEAQLAALGVEVHLEAEVTPENIKTACPDAAGVIVACGAAPLIPPIEGIAEGMENGFVVTAEDVITGKAVVREGQKAAVIGSGLTGLETAEFLLSNGRKLDIIEMLPALGPGVFPAILNDEMSRIKPYDPGLFPGHKLTAIHAPAENEPGYITVEETATGESLDLSADVIILAMGIVPRTELVQAFKEAFGNVYVAGDASQGGRIATATRQGFEAAYTFKA